MSLDVQQCQHLLIYGGSFDPPHVAHIQLPFEAASATGADGVLFVPAGQAPHKNDRDVTESHHRAAMLSAALGDRSDAAIETWEIERKELSYTVHLVQHLRQTLGPDVRLRLLMGADMASIFYAWHRPQLILDTAEPLVMLRPPQTEGDVLAALPDHLSDSERDQWRQRIVPVSQIDVSSTQLRQLLADGQADDPYVTANMDPDVLAYVLEHGLYRDA